MTEYTNRPILITGGTGFIGSYLAMEIMVRPWAWLPITEEEYYCLAAGEGGDTA